MSQFIDLLNQNQGVLTTVAIGLSIIGGLITWLFKKNKSTSYKNSPFIQAGHRISAGGDIIVGGQKNQSVDAKKPEIIIKFDGFTYTTGILNLIFENSGNSTGIINSVIIAGEKIDYKEIILKPDSKLVREFNITDEKVLTQKINEPEIKIGYKNFATQKQYYTIGTIVQQSRADGNFNFESIKNLKFIQ